MEIIDFKDIYYFEEGIAEIVKKNEIYFNICKIAKSNQLLVRLQINRLIENGKYHSDLVIEILSTYGEPIKENDEPNCVLMVCEAICFTKNNRLVKNHLLDDREFIGEMNNLLNKLKFIVNN